MIDILAIPAFVLLVVLAALVFDFYNGLNDAANSIATVVATRALPPFLAVLMAAAFNFLGAFAGTAVAETVGKGIVDPAILDTVTILAALLGAIAWTAVATHAGIPISVSHSLIGGLVGAGLAAGGWAAVQLPEDGRYVQPLLLTLGAGAAAGAVLGLVASLFDGGRRGVYLVGGAVAGSAAYLVYRIFAAEIAIPKLVAVVLFIVYSPLVGFLMAYTFYTLIMAVFRKARPGPVKHVFRFLQVGSSAFYSFSHGTNDAQKTMGIITALLLANEIIAAPASGAFHVPWEVIVASGLAIALGTFLGGYKVVQTMGHRLTRLDTAQGFAAETSSALGLFYLAEFGVPVSTTHSITGSILGVGATKRVSAVSWGVARRIVAAWVITIPASAAVAGVALWVLGRVL